MKQETASVITNREVMPGTHLIWLESPGIAPGAVSPGQFVMVRCGDSPECLLRRPLSIHQLDGNKLALLFTVVGKGTHWLSRCQAGDKIDLLGPLGNGYSIRPGSTSLLLLAGGIGIAPLCFLAQEAVKKDCAVTLLLGAVTANQLYPANLLPPKIKLVTATENDSAGKKGMITDLLADYINEADQVFACGPLAMYRNMALNKPPLNGKPVQVSLEMRMGCGFGVCYGCTVKTRIGLKQVCRDGPVFDLADILWDELVYDC